MGLIYINMYHTSVPRKKKYDNEKISIRKDAKSKLEDFIEAIELPLDVE